MDRRTAPDSNRDVYASLADAYVRSGAAEGLLDAEKAILVRLGDAVSGASLLDIGVGAGRTAPYLSAACGRYVGIDYAETMIQRCRQSFPHLDLRRCDARDLSIFERASFGAVWFSYNGIDAVSPPDRVRVLSEIARVLAPGGTLVFSSHNLCAPPTPPGLWPGWRRQGPVPRRWLSNLRALGRHVGDHLRYRLRKTRQYHGDGYAVLVDTAHGYRLVNCFVTPEYQVGQLEKLGFREIEVIAMDGSQLARATHPPDAWLHYVARKPA